MTARTVISVDAMGGDDGHGPIVAGMRKAAASDPDLFFVVHGDRARLDKSLARPAWFADRVDLRHAPDAIAMDERPSRAVRSGQSTSLHRALESVAQGEAPVAFSAGNTGAIVAMSTLLLRRAPGVHRPAIAVHWPANTPRGANIVLDMGADIRADAESLVQYAVMGAAYARLAFGIERPRVGLLNIGSEETKGRPDLQQARTWLTELSGAPEAGFEHVGFVEGNDITADSVDVIVTDGFTGNIAMKASEGTAKFIRQAMKDAFSHSIFSRFGALFAMTSLARLRKRIDPRRANGGVFLGVNGGVVKSHGGADALGHASALALAAKMARSDFLDHVAAQLAMSESRSLSVTAGNVGKVGDE